jgi:hypothetical protein
VPMLQLGVWQCREIAQRAAPATGAGACTRRRCQSGCRMRVAAWGVAYCCTEGSEESTSRNSVRVYVTYCRVLLMSLGSIEIRHSLNSLPRNDGSLRKSVSQHPHACTCYEYVHNAECTRSTEMNFLSLDSQSESEGHSMVISSAYSDEAARWAEKQVTVECT